MIIGVNLISIKYMHVESSQPENIRTDILFIVQDDDALKNIVEVNLTLLSC